MRNGWRVAATYVGSVVGAGFASGQEISQFFVRFGTNGIWGAVFAGVLFSVLGAICLDAARRKNISSHDVLLKAMGGNRLGTAIDVLLLPFLLASVSVMLAGSGVLFLEAFQAPEVLGVWALAVGTGLIVMAGANRILKFNGWVVAVLVVLILAITGPASIRSFVTAESKGHSMDLVPRHWLNSAFLYVTFNFALTFPVIANLGHVIDKRRTALVGGIIGGMLLAVMLGLGTRALILASVSESEMPLLWVAATQGPVLTYAYIGAIWLAMWTTAVASCYALVERVVTQTGLARWLCTFGLLLLAMSVGHYGFTGLVVVVYPMLGYVGGVMALLTLLYWLRPRAEEHYN